MDTSLKLEDLANVINIIDVCSSRGAFKGEELLSVGSLRQKLHETIQAANNAPINDKTETVEEPNLEE